MRVPVLEPQAETRPLPTPQGEGAGPGAFGAAVGQGLERFGQGVQQVGETAGNIGTQLYQQAQQEMAHTVALDAIASNKGLVNKTVDDFHVLEGKNAIEQSGKAVAALQKQRQAAAEKIASPHAKQMFLEQSQGDLLEATRQIESHTNQQVKAVRAEALDARKKGSLDAVATSYDDPETRKFESENMKFYLGLEADSRGLKGEARDAFINDFDRDIAKVALSQYAAHEDGDGMAAYLKDVRGLLGAEAIPFERQAATIGAANKGERIAQALIPIATDKATGFVTPELAQKALAELDKLPPGHAKDEARQRLEHRIGAQESIQKQQIEDVFSKQLLAAYQRAGSPGNLSMIPPSAIAWLQSRPGGAEKVEAMQRIAQADVQHASGIPPTSDQMRAMVDFEVWAADNPDKAATMTAGDFASTVLPSLAVRDRERAASLLAAHHAVANKPGDLPPQAGKALLGIGREAELFQGANDPSKWSAEQQDLWYRASEQLQTKAADYKRAHEKPAGLEQYEQWARDMMVKGKIQGAGWLPWDPTATRLESETNPKYQGKKFNPDVAPLLKRDREEAIANLRAVGAPINDTAIEKYVRRKHGLPDASTPAPVPGSRPTTWDKR